MTTLNHSIGDFYDRSTPLWLQVWGEHMHHGYYGADGRERKERRQAQIDLVFELLRWAGIGAATHILDAGCGVGGSARLLATHFNARVDGCTLSAVQAEQGGRYNRSAGLEKQVCIEYKDILHLGPPDVLYDLVWSLESAEHIPDKERLLRLFYEQLRPGGQLLLVTWCHRNVPPDLGVPEHRLLERICRNYHLPPLISLSAYAGIAREVGFREIRTADWSAAVAPFRKAVLRSALQIRSFSRLLQCGLPVVRGAWAMRYMEQGFRRGTIGYGLLTAVKDRG